MRTYGYAVASRTTVCVVRIHAPVLFTLRKVQVPVDWDAISNSAALDATALKAQLPILFVLAENGHHPAVEEAGRWKFYSPFRQDGNPSFDVWENDGADRWGDYAEGTNGDVFDLIARFHVCGSFTDQVREAQGYIVRLKASGWTGPTLAPRKAFDLDAARALVERAIKDGDTAQVFDFLRARNDNLQELDAAWLFEEFGVSALGETLIIPYYDRSQHLVTYKSRPLGSKTLAAAGSDFSGVLYGENRDDDTTRPVLLCEGETDTWAAAHALGASWTVLGLPTGVGANPKQASSLAGRKVYLAFDGDVAGRKGVRRWAAALIQESATVFVVPMPDKVDIASCANLADLIHRAKPPILPPAGAPVATTTGYERPGQGKNSIPEQLSNWTFVPERELQYENGAAFEGLIQPAGREAVMTGDNLAGRNALIRWANHHGGSFYGSDKDCQLLLGSLQAEAAYLPTGRMATVAGLHDRQFVWPAGRIGQEHWTYVSPTTDVHLENLLKIEKGLSDASMVLGMRELHCHSVMDPILCWLAMAPLRALCAAFPVLAVTGGSGTGKTTLLSSVVPVFSGSTIQNNLTGTTALPLLAYAGCTNAFPVWFDEYRPGARADTLQTFNQTLRDAYTGQASAKGGMGNHWAEVKQVHAVAPLIVSGEDAFSETSHTQRMILVHLPVNGKNAEALERVLEWPVGPFAYSYLAWLYDRVLSEPLPDIQPMGPLTISSRVRYNFGVLYAGWDLLHRFLADHGYDLPGEPDLTLVAAEAHAAANSNPIRDAVLWAAEEMDPDSGVTINGSEIAVRVESFVAFVQRRGTFTLPGGHLAVRKYLESHYGAVETQFQFGGRSRRSMVMDLQAVEG